MNRRKILFLTGIRSDYGLLKEIMQAVKNHPNLELHLIVSGAHLSDTYGMTVNEIEKDGFEIDAKIKSLIESDSLGSRIKSASIQLTSLIDEIEGIKPDILIAAFDREEAINMALAGVYMNIPIVHIGGGDRVKGNVDDYIRHAVTKLANLHLPATEQNKERIIKMGEEPWRVINVGSAGVDKYITTPSKSKKELSEILDFELGKEFIILLQHPLSSEAEESANQMRITLRAIKELGIKTVLINPNSDAGSRGILDIIEEETKGLDFIKQFKNLKEDIFVNVMRNASALIGNSSAGILEAPVIKLPVVNIGERQLQREHAENVIFVGHDKEKIKEAVKRAVYDKSFREKVQKCSNPYGDGHTSERIAILLSEIKIDRKLLQKEQTY